MKRKTDILQHDVSDCAAACLVSIARHYGKDVPLTVIREASGTSLAGTSFKGIIDACPQFGFCARAYKSDEKDVEALQKLDGPAILHTVNRQGDLHFIVFYGMSRGRALLMDPAAGKHIRLSFERLKEEWTGYLATVRPDPDAGSDISESSVLLNRKSLFRHLRQVPSRTLMLMFAGSLVYIVAGICTALFLQYIIDVVLPSGERSSLIRTGALMLTIMACTLMVGYGRIIYSLRLGILMDGRLILGYLRHLFKLPANFFQRRGAGELNARIGDAVRLRDFLIEGSSSLLTNALILLVSFTLMFTLHWRLSMLMLTFIPIYLILYLAADKVNKRVNRDIMEQSAAFEERTVEGIVAVRTIRCFGGGERLLRRIEKEYILLAQRYFKGGKWAGTLASTADGIAKLLTVTLLTAGSLYIFSGGLTIGELISFYSLTSWFSAPLSDLAKYGGRLAEARIAAERLEDITSLAPEESGQELLEPESGDDIFFDRISFSYPGCPMLLEEFSMVLEHGKITAVQGPSGCGKSSLAALLMRDYNVQKGSVRMGVHDIKLFSLDSWRRFASIVPQEPLLLNASLIDNVSSLESKPDIKRIVTLMDELGLSEWVTGLPMGLLTRIGERGGSISGGQRQRIALARALYRKPSLLVLDEATSSLDEESRILIIRRIERFRDEGGTVMMISHHSDSASCADRTIRMDKIVRT